MQLIDQNKKETKLDYVNLNISNDKGTHILALYTKMENNWNKVLCTVMIQKSAKFKTL